MMEATSPSYVALSLRERLVEILAGTERATLYVGLFDLLPTRYQPKGREAQYSFYHRTSLYVPEGVALRRGVLVNKGMISFVPVPKNRVLYLAGAGIYLTSYHDTPALWAHWEAPLKIEPGTGFVTLSILPGELRLSPEGEV